MAVSGDQHKAVSHRVGDDHAVSQFKSTDVHAFDDFAAAHVRLAGSAAVQAGECADHHAGHHHDVVQTGLCFGISIGAQDVKVLAQQVIAGHAGSCGGSDAGRDGGHFVADPAEEGTAQIQTHEHQQDLVQAADAQFRVTGDKLIQVRPPGGGIAVTAGD